MYFYLSHATHTCRPPLIIIIFLPIFVVTGKGVSSNRRQSIRYGKGVKGGRRGSLALDRSWESINKARDTVDTYRGTVGWGGHLR